MDNPVLNLQEQEAEDTKSSLLRKSSHSVKCGAHHSHYSVFC